MKKIFKNKERFKNNNPVRVHVFPCRSIPKIPRLVLAVRVSAPVSL